MLPDRKKTILSILLVILLIGVTVLVTSIITKTVIKKNSLQPSDNYPNNVMYVGIISKDSNYEKIVLLDNNFNKVSKELNSFYKIKDIHIINNRIVFYSDAVNEIIYDKKKKEYSIREIAQYIEDVQQIKIGFLGVGYLNTNNELFIKYYDNYDNKTIINSNVDQILNFIDDELYYKINNEIKKYNFKTKENSDCNLTEDEIIKNDDIKKDGYERIMKIK